MKNQTFDAIVIGGGITGAGVLRDLALRGVRALLVEKGDLGGATTAASSHLIHGGLRYLLYDRLTTHATCWDSGHIVRIARPFLTRLPILWPVYRNHTRGLETVETLLESYDGFQELKEGKKHLRLSAEETLKCVPGLKKEGLKGGLLFDEFWVDAVSLVKANIDDAMRAGSEVRVQTEVVGIASNPKVKDPRFKVTLCGNDGPEETAYGSVVINAGGPWAESVAKFGGGTVPLRLQKGSHLVFQRTPEVLGSCPFPVGLLLEAVDRDRYIFILPGKGKTLVGPTDIPAKEGPDHLQTTTEEKDYLVQSCRRYFPLFPDHPDSLTVGARPILGQAGPEKLLSRGFQVIDHDRAGGLPGLVTVAGGKMSDFRLMAEEAVDVAVRWTGTRATSSTAQVALGGQGISSPSLGRPPARGLKSFLEVHPRLREWHALSHLALALGKHGARRLIGKHFLSTMEEARSYYEN